MLATDISSLKKLQRGEVVLDTGLTYDGITPVRVRATKREGRLEFLDEGGAVAAARVDRTELRFPESVDIGRHTANVSRQGVVFLPGFASSSDRWLAKLPELVAEASLALYGALLELDD
jgi:pimeloyl-ACP methyl ester carboxylesterase